MKGSKARFMAHCRERFDVISVRHCQVVGPIDEAGQVYAARDRRPHRAPLVHAEIAVELRTPVISDHTAKPAVIKVR